MKYTTAQLITLWNLAIPECPVADLMKNDRHQGLVRHRRAFVMWAMEHGHKPDEVAKLLGRDRTSVLYLRDDFKVDVTQVQLEDSLKARLVQTLESMMAPLTEDNQWRAHATALKAELDEMIDHLTQRRNRVAMLLGA